MAEAVAVLGLVSSILQIAEFSCKVARQFKELQSSQSGAPKCFQDVQMQLDLVAVTLRGVAEQIENDSFEAGNQALRGMVESCRSDIEKLSDIIRAASSGGGAFGVKIVKAMSIIRRKGDVEGLKDSLQSKIALLEFYQVTRSSRGTRQTPARGKVLTYTL